MRTCDFLSKLVLISSILILRQFIGVNLSYATQLSVESQSVVDSIKECFDRTRDTEDALKDKTPDFNLVYQYFTEHYGRPSSFSNDGNYLVMNYNVGILGDNGSKQPGTTQYKFHYEISTNTALFGLIKSTSDPILLGGCSTNYSYTEGNPVKKSRK